VSQAGYGPVCDHLMYHTQRDKGLGCRALMITKPECRSGPQPEFAFYAEAGVNILGSSRSRSRSLHWGLCRSQSKFL